MFHDVLAFFYWNSMGEIAKKPNRILHRIYPVRAIEHQSSLLEGILVQKKGLFARGSRAQKWWQAKGFWDILQKKHTNQPESAKILYIPMICLLSIWLARYPAYVSPWNWLNLTTTKLQYSTSFLLIPDSHLLLRLLTSISIHFWSVVATSARVLGKSPTTSWSNSQRTRYSCSILYIQVILSHARSTPLKTKWTLKY